MVTLDVVPAAQSREAKRLKARNESTVLLIDSAKAMNHTLARSLCLQSQTLTFMLKES
jgi:hypothetical protein